MFFCFLVDLVWQSPQTEQNSQYQSIHGVLQHLSWQQHDKIVTVKNAYHWNKCWDAYNCQSVRVVWFPDDRRSGVCAVHPKLILWAQIDSKKKKWKFSHNQRETRGSNQIKLVLTIKAFTFHIFSGTNLLMNFWHWNY